MKILKFNEALIPSYEQMVDELCRYSDYLSSHTYKDLFELKDSHSSQRYEENLVPVNDIRNYCWYQNRGGGTGITWEFSKRQMMSLNHPKTKEYVREMYYVLQREIVAWNDVDDLETTLLSSLEGIVKYELEFVTDMFFSSWFIDINVTDIKDVDVHFKIIQTFKLLDSRSKGIKEVRLVDNNRKQYYRFQIKHLKSDKEGNPIIDRSRKLKSNADYPF